MKLRPVIVLAALALSLGACAGVSGPVGNDSGGIIPWSAEAEFNKLDIAQANCSRYNTYAVITSVVRGYGNYIAYRCQWYPPHRGRAWRHR